MKTGELLQDRLARFASTMTLCLLAASALFRTSSGHTLTEKRLDDYLVAANAVWKFQGAALVAQDGRILLRAGYGMANRETGVPNTPATKFFIGSITKQFTAAAVMLLQQDGLLNVSDPISKYLPDYPNEASSHITIHQLLTHTSGIPDYTEIPAVMLKRTTALSQSDLLSIFDRKSLEFEPGAQFHYSNSGYVVLGAIIERVSGQSYEAFLQHRLLKPLRMFNSGYARIEMGLPDRADGYTLNEDQGLIRALQVDPPLLHSAGAMYSTVDDMLLWDKELRDDKLLETNSIEAMLTPYAGFYGYGWFIDSLFGRRHAFHGGYLDGFNTTFERWLDDKLCVVVFSNEDEAPVKKIARNLAAIVFEEPYNIPRKRSAVELDPACFSQFTGVYGEGNDIHVIYSQDSSVFDRPSNETSRRLLPLGSDSFFVDMDNTITLYFPRDGSRAVTGCILDDDGIGATYRKLSGPKADSIWVFRRAISVDPAVLDSYVGKYRLETGVENLNSDLYVEIVRRADHLCVVIAEGQVVDIFPYSQTEFFNNSADFLMRFLIDSAGAAVGCKLTLAGASVAAIRVKEDR